MTLARADMLDFIANANAPSEEVLTRARTYIGLLLGLLKGVNVILCSIFWRHMHGLVFD